MRQIPVLLRLIFSNLVILLGPYAVQAAQVKTVVDGNTAFALDLYSQLKTSPGNLFFSPYSISTCLAMTFAGARGDTESQMAQVFHFTKDQAGLHSSFGELQRRLKEASKQKGIELSIANALWSQEGHAFMPGFLGIAKGQYQANVNQIDFKTGADSARTEINHWVANETKDKIQDILAPGTLNGSTRMVLADAIYFKGAWAKRFDKHLTINQPFHVSRGAQVDAPRMYHLDAVSYVETRDFQAAELPYSSNDISMVILLPRQTEGCGQLEQRLSTEFLNRTLAQMKPQEIEILIPRFKLESTFDLSATLAKMGMTDAFGDKADFSGIDGTRFLYISGVFHKAWGEVNEEGTEAAAATSVSVATKSVHEPKPPPPIFRADHPFIFLIRDTRSSSLLFLGRLLDPTK